MRSIIEITTTAVSSANPGYAMVTNDSTIEMTPMPIHSMRIHAGGLTERSALSICYYHVSSHAFKG
jgi:hypothetical protein